MTAHETEDREALEAFFRREPAQNAYSLGYLDDAFASECRWFGSFNDRGTLESVITVYRGLSRPGLFTSGSAHGIAPILDACAEAMPSSVHGRVDTDHMDAVRRRFRPNGPSRVMSRMALRRDEFIDRDEDRDTAGVVAQLTHRDTGAIMRLYSFWPDHFFEPYQLGSGLYFGVRLPDGSIASIAGIHNVSLRYDIAAIANLVTHPEHRGRGFARLCNARLLRELFQRVSLVTLDVQQDNEPAIRTYRHFGFRPWCTFHEGELVRR